MSASTEETNIEPETKRRRISPPRKVQINVQDVEAIIKEVLAKESWQEKIGVYENKWREEALSQNVSSASVTVAFEILTDMVKKGRGVKHCCGQCGAKPEKEERSDEEDEDYRYYYSRDAKFCLCPCSHCALNIDEVPEVVCRVKDNLIPEELRQKLKKGLEPFENVPDERKDWHPGSNKQVLDLIHPSLYPYVHGISMRLTKKVFPIDTEKKPQLNLWGAPVRSKPKFPKFQWMPAEFEIGPKDSVTIQSYINNVDPYEHKDLYDTIGQIFSKFIPDLRKIISFKKNLQVVVKAANVIVEPDRCYFPGGVWHTEGDEQDAIAASCIYYYENDNVKDSFLEFRRTVDDTDIMYEQDRPEQAFANGGLHDGDLCFEVLGGVETIQDRCILFPNTHQHRVAHFFSKDPSRRAVRKILVFFVVDPDIQVVSTKYVPPQQLRTISNSLVCLSKMLPFDIVQQHIAPFLPHFTLKQAKEYREQLMEARKYYIDEENEEYEREFSLCEH